MKKLPVIVCLFALVSAALAQENRLPQKEAQRYAKLCVDQTGTPYSGQLTTDVNVQKACAERGEGGGAMVIPDKKLSEKSLQQAGKDIVPVGELWLRKWTLVVKGKAVPKKKLRMLTLNIDDKDRPMSLFLLGLRRAGAKNLELVVYAKDNKPLQVLPLKKLGILQNLPLELEWQRGEKQADPLALKVLGKYQTTLKITRQ